MIIRINVSTVRLVGRSTQGVRLMNPYGEDRLVSIAKVEREEEVLVEGDGGDGDLVENLGTGIEAAADADLADEDLEGFEGDESEISGEDDPETVH